MPPLHSVFSTGPGTSLAQAALDYAQALHLRVTRAELSYAQALSLLREEGPLPLPRAVSRNQAAGRQLALRRFKELQGVSPPRAVACVRFGGPLPSVGVWTAICDGSYKAERGSAGVLVQDDSAHTRAEVSVPLQATASAVDAELRACLLALTTAAALGAKWLVVLVDAQSVLAALEGKLPHRHSVMEGMLAYAVSRLGGVEVRKVGRAWTAPADELADAAHKVPIAGAVA